MVVIGIVVAVVLLVVWILTAKNRAGAFESNLEGFQAKTKTSVSTLINTLKSEQFITGDYASVATTAIDKTFKGRFGEGGSKAVFLALKEANIPISPERWESWSRKNASLWAELETSQNTMLDEVTRYKRWLTSWQSTPAHVLGYPRVDLKQYYDVMLASGAKEAFETKTIDASGVYDTGKK